VLRYGTSILSRFSSFFLSFFLGSFNKEEVTSHKILSS
jgi:hypothetical protein